MYLSETAGFSFPLKKSQNVTLRDGALEEQESDLPQAREFQHLAEARPSLSSSLRTRERSTVNAAGDCRESLTYLNVTDDGTARLIQESDTNLELKIIKPFSKNRKTKGHT